MELQLNSNDWASVGEAETGVFESPRWGNTCRRLLYSQQEGARQVGSEEWKDPWEPVPLAEGFLHSGDIKECVFSFPDLKHCLYSL